MPDAHAEFALGWQRLHPDWEYRLWTEADLPRLHNQDLYDRAEDLCPGFEGQLRSDVVRYELLLQYGGVWVDTDFECLKPLDGLLKDVSCFAAYERQGHIVNNAILGCEPGHTFMLRLVANLNASVTGRKGRRPSKVSGPHYLTDQYRRDPLNLTVFSEHLFYPYRCDQLDHAGASFPDAYAVHHWANQRRLRRKPL